MDSLREKKQMCFKMTIYRIGKEKETGKTTEIDQARDGLWPRGGAGAGSHVKISPRSSSSASSSSLSSKLPSRAAIGGSTKFRARAVASAARSQCCRSCRELA
jgi:hypothetical protein